MARRGQRTSYQQRIEIGERASAGESDCEIGPVHGLLGLDGALGFILLVWRRRR
jgi:hypothetical protein